MNRWCCSVDEVDRTEEAMEALLLEVLAERQVTIPEIGTFAARSVPWVVLTSNDTRELSTALKRRCLHYHLGFPTTERERDIVSLRAPHVTRRHRARRGRACPYAAGTAAAKEPVDLRSGRCGTGGNSVGWQHHRRHPAVRTGEVQQ